MNVSGLYKQVAQLGFEDSLENETRFIYAVNRALMQVCKIKPAVGSYIINHRPLENSIKIDTFVPIERAEDLTFEAEAVKSYYLEADGNGILYIEKYDTANGSWATVDSKPLASSGAFVSYKGFIKDGGEFITGLVRLRLSGEYLYSVRNVALYKNILSANASDIPAYEPFTRYDMKTLVTNFLGLICPPIVDGEKNVVLNQDYRLEGDSVVLLPYNKKGVYKFLYECAPTEIVYDGDANGDTTEIDLDEELCTLLPNLVAAYVWVDDEPAKSEYYMSLYRERAMDIERRRVKVNPVIVRNITGW